VIHLLAVTSPEARFQALVTLLGGVVAILVVVGGFVWRVGVWVQREAAATRANTRALMGTDGHPGLIDTVADMSQALDRLTAQLEGPRGGGYGRRGRDRTTR
jgi:hypothetical protein